MLKRYGLKTFVILFILFLSAVIAYTHSGRTDANGGHFDRKNGGYHLHQYVPNACKQSQLTRIK